jgi:glycosyltransferase involved in cell wall biosynthesis
MKTIPIAGSHFQEAPRSDDDRVRVAMIAHRFPLQGDMIAGGVPAASIYLAQALAATGDVDLTIVRPFGESGIPSEYRIGSIPVYSVRATPHYPRSLHFFDIRRTMAFLRSISPDLVHVQGYPTWTNHCPWPSVVTIHGISEKDAFFEGPGLAPRVKSRLLGMREIRARRKAAHIIAISPYVRRLLPDRGGQRIWDIPNPVNPAFFGIRRTPVPLRFFSASHISPLKNVAGLIRAFARFALQRPGAELRLAGDRKDEPYGQECLALARTLGVAERVRFLGSLKTGGIIEELASAEAFLLASRQENAPVSVAEAMASGVPVIVSAVGGLPWMVREGQDGFLVGPDDEAAMAEAMARMEKPDLAGAMGASARRRAEELFSPERVARRTIAVYREILGTRSPKIH